jgi:hypothetical protein
MLLIFCAFLIISIFELKCLFKTKEKKEAIIYIIISGAAVALAIFMMLVPDYKSFSKLILGIMGGNQ